MKRTLLLFITLVVATMGGDVIKEVAEGLGLTREEVQTCFNERDVTSEDVMHYDQYVENDVRTADYDSVLKVSCFLACSMEKKGAMTGAHINADKMKEIIRPPPRVLERHSQIIDTCANQAKNGTNECEVSLKFVLCFRDEIKSAYENNDDNE